MYFLTLEGLDYVLQCTVIESSLNVDGVDTHSNKFPNGI